MLLHIAMVNATRVNLLGASGCGASSTGRALAEVLALPYFDCDDFFHAPTDPPFQKQRSPQERHDVLVSALDPVPSWVLGGGVANWDPYPALDFTLVVFLWVPAEVRLQRLRQRERARFGARVLAGGDMHTQHEAFIAWAMRYDDGDVEGKTLARHEAYLSTLRCPVLDLRGELPLEERRTAVLNALGIQPAEGRI